MNHDRALLEENELLRKQLQETQDLIAAIRNGKVDALVVSNKGEDSVYTLQGADRTYRILIETMAEGAVILSREAVILYCNRSLAQILHVPLEQLTGSSITRYIADQDREEFHKVHHRIFEGENIRTEINLLSSHQANIPSLISLRMLSTDGMDTACMVVTDLTEQKKTDASLAEKEVLLKEIHHRVKNNLQVISSLVDLQAEQIDDAALSDIFKDVTHRVRSMAMVHEKLYKSTNFSSVEFADYTQSLLGYLWRSHGAARPGLKLKLELEPVLLPVNEAIPCGLILNELITNSLKHAFVDRDHGTVTVSLLKKEQKQVILSVQDDGIGIPPAIIFETSRSLGLRLINMLCRQLHASLKVQRNKGTLVMIILNPQRS